MLKFKKLSPHKILIVRFSSIGDIVLTTPVIRCIRKKFPDCELHFVTKESFRSVLVHNPYVDKILSFKKDVKEIFEQLKDENYDVVVDLHKNLRSLRLKSALRSKSFSFDKINLRKFFAVNFKMLNLLPQKHIVDRYLEAVQPLGVIDDGMGLDYFIAENEEVNVAEKYFSGRAQRYISLVVGGSYYTKKIPINKLSEIIQNAALPVILLGGPEDTLISSRLKSLFPSVIDTCGLLSINQSASVVKNAEWVITSDTGMMHIAAAYHKKIISVWGNTIPSFGMGPYKPHEQNKILEVNDLSCRPCSKLGYKQCPLGHFKCMNDQNFDLVKDL